ncbi:hypothetical protein [Pedobacter sp. ASV28]|uniref:hypothetical protein n=1 Tax=Pedobacter sp. ASV28 TaxID=2795123 RepID=UPI0018ED9284|nr:hypothetical protein [Pedobacter sp. ASV28]
MRLYLNKRLQRTAQFLLLVMLLNILHPVTAFALTSGPAQPEALSFQPVGMTDMVDLFTGDFKYNIPLLEVDGYPLNLNYQSGSGMDDEASWVGLGWNLNVGSISRQVRGIPDDLGGEVIETEHSTKKKVTVGGRVTATAEFKGVNSKIMGSFSLGVFNDNYTGIGAEIGVNAGLSIGLNSTGSMTAGMGLGILSNTSSGVDVSPYVSLSLIDKKNEDKSRSSSLSSSLTYNSRSGMKSLSLGQSYNETGNSINPFQSSWSYNTGPVMPKIQVPYESAYRSFSFSAGPAAMGMFAGIGGTGYMSTRNIISKINRNPAFGFLYADKGKNLANAVHDFTREKDNPIIPELPNLAIPIHTPDLFSYNSQKGSGQFRLFRATGMLGDNQAIDKSDNISLGFDVGLGWIVHGGLSLYKQDAKTITRKWTKDNAYMAKGDFQSYDKSNPAKEHVFFRKTDEKVMQDDALAGKLGENEVLAVNISGKNASSSFGKKAGNQPVNQTIEKTGRQLKQTNISYLTAKEVELQGLDKEIKTYPFLENIATPSQWGTSNGVVTRNTNQKRDHHISEITVTETDNSRQVYGIPVYNLRQDEYSFAIGKAGQYNLVNPNGGPPNGPTNLALVPLKNGQIDYEKGIDEYYHVDHQSPYASSYLLTALLSPDYVDKTNDGISDDDLGSAIKFNYSKLANNYNWRTPYVNQSNTDKIAVTVNKGLLADPDDDKGSFIYGEKEIYYPQSIESKTHIAIFITANREDALGVVDWKGQRNTNIAQKKLMEIRLYAKGDLTTPVKVVKFHYEYLLCGQTPNSAGNGKKLTLTKVWFEYGKTTKGQNHPYVFTYYTGVDYQVMATDRWGTYKPKDNNTIAALNNEEFPYSVQDRTKANTYVTAFQLKEIELPSGGKIKVGYEADDYAYVQNKKASTMQPILGFIGGNRGPGDLRDKRGLEIAVDDMPPGGADHTEWFKDHYLDGSNYIYTKSLIKFSTDNGLSGGQDNDYVSAYGKVLSVIFTNVNQVKKATVMFETITDKSTENPILFAAWQKMKNEYPRYAYPGFKNKVSVNNAGDAIEAAVSAILNAAGNLSELKQNFYEKAYNRGYASTVFPEKCFVRLVEQKGSKIGGGLRVKYITIEDEWQQMSGDTDAPAASYGQWYDYTIIENGKRISSGVATYEPAIGSDENSLRQPVFYSHKIKGGLSDMFELELPFGESLYPSASVGYRKVSIRDLDPHTNLQQLDIEDQAPRTGTTEQEFYTAKDFPVRVEALTMQRHINKPSQEYSMFFSNSVEELVLSQGYSIELNDMHGKQKAIRSFNAGGTEINATEYEYQVENPNAQELRLKNEVNIIHGIQQGPFDVQRGSVLPNRVMGRDVELFTDFREQEYTNSGTSLNPGLDAFAAWIVPVIFAYSLYAQNNEYRLFRSAVATKVIHNSGILKKVIKTEDGSSTSTENIAYDGLTGEAIVTRTQNEFNQYLYAINLPAYWKYPLMGGAYQNLGMILSDVTVDASGEINSAYWPLLDQGDMLIDLASNKRYWTVSIRNEIGTPTLPLIMPYYTKMLIDEEGKKVTVLEEGTNLKVWRSAHNNKLGAMTSSIICLENPIKDDQLMLAKNINLANYKVLNANYASYDQVWPIDGKGEEEVGYVNELYDLSYFKFIQNEANMGTYSTLIQVPPSTGLEFIEVNHPYFSSLNTTSTIYSSSFPQTLHGFSVKLNVTRAGTFFMHTYIGNGLSQSWLRVNGVGINSGFGTTSVIAISLNEGDNLIDFQYNSSSTTAAKIGFTIMDNTYSEIINTAKTSYNIIFSTSILTSPTTLSDPNINFYRVVNNQPIWYRMYENVYNPFIHGMLGNWRPSAQYVYQSKRTQTHLSPTQKSANVAQNGYFEHFYSPWTTNSPYWVKSNQITLYDKYGQELENKDALGRYSAAKFDFRGELPAVVASNAQNRDLYHETFEDFSYSGSASKQRFTSETNEVLGNIIPNMQSHTGLRAGKIEGGKTYKLTTSYHEQEYGPFMNYFIHDSKKQFQLVKNINGLYPNGFEPGKKEYVFSAWIKDAATHTKVNTLQLSYKGKNANTMTTINPKTKAIVEGWKLVEGVIDFSTLVDTGIEISLSNNVDLPIDDIRIYPKEALVKTYAYNQRTFKLMAELDENNFATFYEYDDEGQLVRVKKETERGIVTLKETRAIYRKRSSTP